jgi:hypothetical protein
MDWLLEGDPAIAWQTKRDLYGEVDPALRARVPREGIGAALLGARGSDGAWAKDGQSHWLPTLFSMQLLRATGADPNDPMVYAAVERLEHNWRWPEEHGAKPFSGGETEPCINGGALAASSYFGHADAELVQRLLTDQLSDGGWNCEKSAVSSFHSTICVLEGLLEYERAVGGDAVVAFARRRGESYLLERSLFRRRSNGEVVRPEFLELAYPPRYHYDVLRALDYFRAADVPCESRHDEAIKIVEKKRVDGGWLLEQSYPESVFDEQVGEPSRWNTLRALRVLEWATR